MVPGDAQSPQAAKRKRTSLKFFAAKNLVSQSVVPAVPWEFQITGPVNDQIRHDKAARQLWYRNPSTSHSFYTAVEASNPNGRVSRQDNPPRLLHGIVGDFDSKVPPETVQLGIAAMPHKPSWVERSLGGNIRLVWVFPRPLLVESYEFCTLLLQHAIKWLQVDLLPALDRPAFEDPARLYCNGGNWTATGHPAISETALQAFFVKCGSDYRFKAPEGTEIALGEIEKELARRFPNFCWPSEFTPESSGPSFWIPGSESSNSAILKPDGFFTFSAHADKPFYSWADILGSEWTKVQSDESIAKATANVWHDGRKFWRLKRGVYTAMEQTELSNYLKVDCGLKKCAEQAMSFIYNENHVENAAPYLFRPPGLLIYQGRRRLNTSLNELLKPAPGGAQTWGPAGEFPFLSALLDNLFTSDIQRDHFLAWWRYFYECGVKQAPQPGPAVFLMGGVCIGKTFVNREVVGTSVGGYVDAASYLLRGSEFNSHLFEHPLWCLDDDTISDTPQAAANVQAMLKKAVANSSFLSNKKFQAAGMVEWAGRIIATTNLDYVSSRVLGPLDNSSLDKISVFRCQSTSKIKFPSRPDMIRITQEELPKILRWLLDWDVPEHVPRDTRFGFKTWHEASLMEQSAQTSKSAPFKEILIQTLDEFFENCPDEKEWRGTVSKLIQQLHMNAMNECVIRTLRLEQVARYLEQVEKDGALKCWTETGPLNVRLWVFPRPAAPEKPAVALPPESSIFDKPV